MQVSSLPLANLMKEYFVPIFALCMAVHCSEGPDKEIAGTVLSESILHFAEISELERDDLIKRHMVCFEFSFLNI